MCKEKPKCCEKVKELAGKVKAKYEALPPKKKECVKYGSVAVVGAVVGGVLGYLLGRHKR